MESRQVRCVLVWLIGVAVLLLASRSQAQSSVLVLVSRDSFANYETYEHRLRSELMAEGALSVSAEIGSEITLEVLRAQAQRLNIRAAIALQAKRGRISGQVWMSGKDGEGELLRPLPEYEVEQGKEAAFAVRAVSILQGMSLELGYAGKDPARSVLETDSASLKSAQDHPAREAPLNQAQPESIINSSAEANARNQLEASARIAPAISGSSSNQASASRPAWELRALATMATHFLKFPTNGGLSVAGMWHGRPSFAIGVNGTHLFASTLDASAEFGTVTLTQTFAGVRAEHSLQMLNGAVALVSGLEGGISQLRVQGHAVSPHHSRKPHSVSGYTSLSIGLKYYVYRPLALMAQLGLIAPWKRADILVANAVVAEASGPALLNQVGAAVEF